MGKRAVAVQIAHDRYRPATIAETIRVSNRRTALITMIETEEGLANVEAIAAVKDVDCLWLGHFDLSTSLGIPGQFEHPKFVRAVNRIVAAGRRNGISLGRLVTSPEGARAASRQGFDTLCYDGDIWLYHKALSTGLAEARKACAPSGRGRAR
jgi:2-keto-3-deoxy-L-rhamnonate aldolase RhmA